MSAKLNLPMEQIVEEYLGGMSTCELGKKYRCSDVTIGNRLKEVGIGMRSCNEVRTLDLPMKQIIEEYLEGISPHKLGKKYDCHSSTIIDRLRQVGIKIRSLNEAQQNRFEDPKEHEKLSIGLKKYYKDHPEVQKEMSIRQLQYHEDNPEVGKKHSEKLKKYYEDNPEEREKMIAAQNKRYENPKAREKISMAMKKYHKDNPEAAKEHGKVTKKVMEAPKVKQNLSKGQKKRFEDLKERENTSKAGKKYYEDNPEVLIEMSVRMKKYYKDNPEARIKLSCINLGITREEWDGFKKTYCDLWTEELREHIRDKYGRKCFICGLSESENKFKNGKQVKLSVHHVDYNKQCGCDGTECRLVPLCIEHHGQTTSGDREMWEEIITDMIDNLIEN